MGEAETFSGLERNIKSSINLIESSSLIVVMKLEAKREVALTNTQCLSDNVNITTQFFMIGTVKVLTLWKYISICTLLIPLGKLCI